MRPRPHLRVRHQFNAAEGGRISPLLAEPAPWCPAKTIAALVLAMDVSNSVDEAEYRLQIDGLADALADAGDFFAF